MGMFEGLEDLGFGDVDGLELFPTTEAAKPKEVKREENVENPKDYLYLKENDCPVCTRTFEAIIVRRSKLKVIDRETDLKTRFHTIDPNLYDVLICSHCGYAAMANSFSQIVDRQKELVKEKITPRFNYKEYEVPYNFADAVERYKMALLCAAVTGMRAGQKAILCLKLAWVYRDMGDKANETVFLKHAVTGLKEAFTHESFPIGPFDEPTCKYMIGELLRRVGELQEAMRWISELMVDRGTPPSLKEKANFIKEMIREGKNN
jgi:hypothetical protein